MKVIDFHNHFVPKAYVEWVGTGRLSPAVEVTPAGKLRYTGVAYGRGTQEYPITDAYDDPARRLSDMDAMGIDVAVVSPSPFVFHYWSDAAGEASGHRLVNDALAEHVERDRERLIGLGTVPLQDPGLAIQELRRCHQELGFAGVEIGTNVRGVYLDAPALKPFWDAAEELGSLIFIHPYDVFGCEALTAYHLRNVIGNPSDTANAAARLIFGGVLSAHPGLRFVLSHGGGTLPILAGRMDRAYATRPECQSIDAPPSTLLRRFIFDTVTHHPAVIDFLRRVVGEDRLVCGTDYPFDMGDADPLKVVRESGLTLERLSANGLAFLGQAPAA